MTRGPHDPRWPAEESIRIPPRRYASADAGQAAPEQLRQGTDYSVRPAQRYPRTAISGAVNGMPPDRPYKYGQQRARWALQRIADAQAQWPEDAAPDRPRKQAGKQAGNADINPARVIAAIKEGGGRDATSSVAGR